MKNNKKIISEISRLHELMGVKSNVLNEQAGVIDDILKKVLPDVFKVADSPIAKAYRKMADETIDVAERKQAMEEFIGLSKKEMPELYAQIRRIALDDSEIKTVIDNLFTSEQKQTFSNNVETLLKRGDTDEEVMSQYKNSINRSDLTQSERAALEQRMRDEISTIRTRLVDSGEIAPLADDAASTVTKRTRITDDPTTPKTGDEVADDAAKTGDEVADDAAKAGDEVADDAAKAGENPVDNFTPDDVKEPIATLEEMTARKMEDIPNLTDDEMKAFMKDPKWYNFIKRIQNGTTIADMWTNQLKLMEQSQKIMNELLNNKNLGSVAKRNLEDRLNRNMLSLANYKGNKSYLDFYRWADDLFSSSTDKNVKKWWAATKKKDGFVMLSELEKRGPWYKQLGTGFKDGWKSMKESTWDYWNRVGQIFNPVRQYKVARNAMAKLAGKNPPFTLKAATEAQKKAFKKWFWWGNRTGYSGFGKYLAENGALAATSRLVTQFGRGYLIVNAVITAAEVIFKGGFSKEEGYENWRDLLYYAFSEFWDNISGFKYAIPAYYIGRPLIDLIGNQIYAFAFKGYSTDEAWDEWYEEYLEPMIGKWSEEVNTVLSENPNNDDGPNPPTDSDDSPDTTPEDQESETTTDSNQQVSGLSDIGITATDNDGDGVWESEYGELFKLENDKWKVSYDNGNTWEEI